jgi:hypothetical protein
VASSRFYLITLSALASTLGGIVRPICFAAFKCWFYGSRDQAGTLHLVVNDQTKTLHIVELQRTFWQTWPSFNDGQPAVDWLVHSKLAELPRLTVSSPERIEDTSVVSHAVCSLSKTALARPMMSSALAVQTKGLGFCCDAEYKLGSQLSNQRPT